MYWKMKRTKRNEEANEKFCYNNDPVPHSIRSRVVMTGKLLTSKPADVDALEKGLVPVTSLITGITLGWVVMVVVEDWF